MKLYLSIRGVLPLLLLLLLPLPLTQYFEHFASIIPCLVPVNPCLSQLLLHLTKPLVELHILSSLLLSTSVFLRAITGIPGDRGGERSRFRKKRRRWRKRNSKTWLVNVIAGGTGCC